MSRQPLILPPGTLLGGYAIEDVIGIGGMAVVYRAVQQSLGRRVALKVLNPRLAADATFRERFRREGAMVAALDHPHVVPVHDFGEAEGRLYLAMRLIDGVTLADVIEGEGLTAHEAVRILRPISAAVDAAHRAAVLHRDIKPQNVLLASDGSVYLADFGVARTLTSDLTRTREFFGSVSYVAPEQIRGESIGAPADIYAFAVMAYHCLTGRTPFQHETDAGTIHAHLETPPPRIGDGIAPWSAGLTGVVGRGMAKEPDGRPATATAFVDELAAALADVPAEHATRRPPFAPVVGDGAVGTSAAGVQAGVAAASDHTLVVAPSPEPNARAAQPESSPAAAPHEPTFFDRRRPDLVVPAVRDGRRRRRVLIGALATVIAAAVVGGAVLLGAGSSTTDPPRALTVSGAPAVVTQAADEASRVATQRAAEAERAAERRRVAERREAQRRAAARRRAAERQTPAPAPATSSGSTARSVAPAPAPAPAPARSSSGSGGSSRVCDFPPC